MKTLINIFGAGRSGTTMLDLMLGNDDKSFSLGEIHAWFRPFREHHKKIICSCGDDPCPYWKRIQNSTEEKFHSQVFTEFEVEYLIDSSKNINWGIDVSLWLNSTDIRIINLVIYKNPINYIYSIWKRGEDIDSAIYRYEIYYKRFLESNLSFAAISYEELVGHTDETLNTICKITGQNFFKDRKKFWNKQHHHAFGSMGTRKQLEKGESLIREKEEFKKEYIELIPKIEEKINTNKDLQYIKRKLLVHDIKNGYQESSLALKKPMWYHMQNLKSFYKKRFPNEWKYEQ